jgi:hypothetical protein
LIPLTGIFVTNRIYQNQVGLSGILVWVAIKEKRYRESLWMLNLNALTFQVAGGHYKNSWMSFMGWEPIWLGYKGNFFECRPVV